MMMTKEGKTKRFLVLVLAATLLSNSLVVSVLGCRNPRHGCPPSGGSPPSHTGGGSYYGPTPPSHSGGGSYGPPSHGGSGSYGPPSHGGSGSGPPSTPSHGGGYYAPPGGNVNPPSTPTPVTPTPYTPTPTPYVPTPSTPYTPPYDPNSHPITGTCDFWRTHPTLIWGVLGYWGTLGGLFGPLCTSYFGNPTIPQALSSNRQDGYGALLREGAAAYLNSVANAKFPYNTQQVRDGFTTGLLSDKAASEQAQRFRLANEGHVKK